MTFFPYPAAFIEGIGGPEMIMILVLVLVMFGGKKLP
jgi:Sec-independent protein translocase protein TatA